MVQSVLVGRWSAVLKAALSVAMTAASACSVAATYYVDADQGNDNLNGLSAVADGSGQSGPWLTLAKVSAAPLQPGDQVLLRCGHSWRETLAISRAGVEGNPVTIGSNPSACSNKPAIDGALNIPTDAWQRHAGNIYRADLPFSVIPGPQLSASSAGWSIASASGAASLVFQPTCRASTAGGCAAVVANTAAPSVLSSPGFSVRAGQKYTIRVQLLGLRSGRYNMVVRSNTSGQDLSVGFRAASAGRWQDVAVSFTPTMTSLDARLDIEFPAISGTSYVRLARVEQELESGFSVADVSAQRSDLRRAHHPNMGYNPVRPSSPYLSAGVSAYVLGPDGRLGSNYLVTGTDLALPGGATLAPGIDVWIRSQAWSVKRHQVTSVAPNRLNISPVSAYPLAYPGWGYFLTGALWMLDSPGEWFYDSNTKSIYVWMPDGRAPGARMSLSTLSRGVSIGNPDIGQFPSFITLDNLRISNVGTGVSIRRMTNISMKSLDLRDLADFGVDGEGAARMRIEDSAFANTGSDAISGIGANDVVVSNNTILNSGVKVNAAGQPVSLPRENFHVVQLGMRANVTGNSIKNAAYNGILVGNDSVVSDNVVENYVLILNDGGGIYASNTSGVVVRNNQVINGVGNLDGLPSVFNTQVVALYLDDYTKNYLIQGNTLAYSDYCMLMHNASNNTADGNICYGARRSTVRLQETARDVNPNGNVFGNVFRSNQFVQTSTGPTIVQDSNLTSLDDFASFDRNAYSSLRTPLVSQENGPNGYQGSFTLSEWQRAGRQTGRTLEPNGYIAAPLSRYASGLLDPNLLSAVDAQSDWGRGGSVLPLPTVTIASNCGPQGGPCTIFNAGGGTATLTGPRFALVKGNRYRVSFDGLVSDPAQVLSTLVLRAGPTYESLMGLEPFVFGASTSWKRYNFTFVATANATAARIDFNDILAGREVRLANLEVTPFASTGVESISVLLANTDNQSRSYTCPTLTTQPTACDKFFSFADGRRINWPYSLAPRSSLVVFSQDNSLTDSDGDGVADVQDRCPATSADAAVDASGCALNQ